MRRFPIRLALLIQTYNEAATALRHKATAVETIIGYRQLRPLRLRTMQSQVYFSALRYTITRAIRRRHRINVPPAYVASSKRLSP
jgi:hypothetical protein